jgi:hypothetical protein
MLSTIYLTQLVYSSLINKKKGCDLFQGTALIVLLTGLIKHLSKFVDHDHDKGKQQRYDAEVQHPAELLQSTVS